MFNDYVRAMTDEDLRYHYDIFEEYIQSGILHSDEVRRTLEFYYGSSYSVHILFATMTVYREVARRYYDPSEQPF